MNHIQCDHLILGAGLAGLTLCSKLKSKDTIVLEKSDKPGGLVQSIEINGFWFDKVLHLLHFQNKSTQNKLLKILGSNFKPLIPKAKVYTNLGTTDFPFQLNLGGLEKETALACAMDYISNAQTQNNSITNFKEWLRFSFGERMCEVFFYPYNQKMWKRPLKDLGTRDFTWTIQNFDIKKVLAGLIPEEKKVESYNANSWYPRPRKNAKMRCMGLLTEKIYKECKSQVQLNEEVIELNTNKKIVITQKGNSRKTYHYKKQCISTLPLSILQNISKPVLKKKYPLKANGVVYAMVMLKGKKYKTDSLWDYFADKAYAFSRVIYMQNFDPHTAPAGKWSVMTETTYRAEDSIPTKTKMAMQVSKDLLKAGVIKNMNQVIDIHFEIIPYAYAVFLKDTSKHLKKLIAYFTSRNVQLLGRYGKWQYVSMAQVYEEATALAKSINAKS